MSTPQISIVTSTFSPDSKVLQRCLDAVASLEHPGFEIEYFLVDNNSPNPVGDIPFVKEFLDRWPWAKLLVERQQGASYGKMCGFKASSAPLIVFFDDDNEPDSDYLMEALDYSRRLSQVGAFGPGIVRVEYVDGAEAWLEQYKYIFQDNERSEEMHSCIPSEFQSYYPVGTGLVMKREAVSPYADLLARGKLRASCRKGENLSSGGDMQMVFLNLKLGFEAGTSPKLKLRHLINSKKANRKYIRRLTYGCAVSALQARLEVFPEEIESYRLHIISGSKAIAILLMILLRSFGDKDLDLRLIEQIGSVHSYRDFFEIPRPRFTMWLARVLGVE